jgi:hypothetical protein
MKHPAREHLKLLGPAADAAVKKVHTEFAPSKSHRWLVCPGSQLFMSDDPETEWAAEGTRKHAVLEPSSASDKPAPNLSSRGTSSRPRPARTW